MYQLENLSERYQERFHRTFTPIVVDAMLGAVNRAYVSACEMHHPERGSGQSNFGLGVYNCARHELALLAEAADAPWRVTSLNPLFWLDVAGLAVASYRVGSHERRNILTSFPRPGRNGTPSAGKGEWAVSEHMQLPLFSESELPAHEPSRLVLCHMGNSEDGFCAAYLCAPLRLKGKRKIIQWGLTHLLWKRDEGRTGYLDQPVRPEERPAPEVIPETAPRRRVRPQPNVET